MLRKIPIDGPSGTGQDAGRLASAEGAAAPVFALRLVEVAPAQFERLYGEIASFCSGPGAELPGLVEARIFGSTDARRIALLTQFRSRHDWARAQWDARLGELLEEIAANAVTLDFGLYHGDFFCTNGLA